MISPEAEKLLTAEQDLALARAAYGRKGSNANRLRYARLLMLDEAFAEVVAMFGTADGLDYGEAMLLAQAHLSLERGDSDLSVIACADRAIDLAPASPEQAQALATRGKAEKRLGQIAEARRSFLQALELDPANKDACKRLAALDLESGLSADFLAISEELLARGGGHARLFAAQTLAHARNGDLAAASAAAGYPDLFQIERLPPPPGWDSIEAFNAALAQELLAHPGIRFERYGSASVRTWRIESPSRQDTPLFRQLVDMIITELDNYGERVAGLDHVWTESRPDAARLRIWCVITEGEGFEDWHVHQFGWASGVFYVQIPDSIAEGSGKGGCLAFGLPVNLAGQAVSEAFGERLIRPRSGLFMAFPSHSYHRTYPHGMGEKRICVAFDVRPT